MTHRALWQLDWGKFQRIVTHSISGKHLILIFNEAIWLVDQMQHTLLNPNQLRSFGMLVKDDPFALDETIRIESENRDAVLPLHTEGTIIYLDTWTPTDEDLSQFPHIIMTSTHPWNPSEVQFPNTSRRVEEELTMRSIASSTTDHGMSTIKIDDFLDREDCLYSTGKLSHRMLSGVRVLEAPIVQEVQISDMKQTIAETSEETNVFTPMIFQSS